jgi:hypothetical protein
MVCVPTTGTHLFSPLTYSYSVPSSVSRIHLPSSWEKEILGSLPNSEGELGKPDRAVSEELVVSSIAVRMLGGIGD